MSKVLRIQKGGYKVIAESGSEIRFDPGSDGRVNIVGSLYVQGDTILGSTTSVTQQDLVIEDRLITLNNGQQGSEISYNGSNQMSGLIIDRGNADVLMVFDEKPFRGQTTNPLAYNLLSPSFVLKDNSSNENLKPLTTNRIQTYGVDDGSNNQHLTFYTGYEGVVRVDYTTAEPGEPESAFVPYHERIANDNDIPNFKFLKNYVNAEAGQAIIQRVYRYTEGTFDNTFSGIEAKDITQAGDGFSGVLFITGSGPFAARAKNTATKIGRFGTDTGIIIGRGESNSNNIKLIIDGAQNTMISTDNSNLVINPYTGSVVLRNVLRFEHLPNSIAEPIPALEQNVVYSRNELGSGGTGLYFVNTAGDGEFCSASNALVYSLIF